MCLVWSSTPQKSAPRRTEEQVHITLYSADMWTSEGLIQALHRSLVATEENHILPIQSELLKRGNHISKTTATRKEICICNNKDRQSLLLEMDWHLYFTNIFNLFLSNLGISFFYLLEWSSQWRHLVFFFWDTAAKTASQLSGAFQWFENIRGKSHW